MSRSVIMTMSFDAPAGSWDGWAVIRDASWTHFAVPDRRLPEQGWKIHVSTTPANAVKTLGLVAEWCRTERWPFKHLRDPLLVARANDKGAARSSSGKFITIYPPQAALNEDVLDRLAAHLHELPGPRVLGDLQWRDSCVHLRFGAFRPMRTWNGARAIRSPDGTLEPDERGVVFRTPPWLSLPGWVQAEFDRAEKSISGDLDELKVDGAYSFSNAGGVYRADHRRHGRVVLKEGREHVAVLDGVDAAARIEHEHAVLEQIGSLGLAPRALGTFRSGGSAFALLEQLDGVPFNRAVMSRNPLVRSPRPSRAERARFAASVERSVEALRSQLGVLHAHGFVHGDVAPRNVIVRATEGVSLIDFESADCIGAPRPTAVRIGTPGFAAPVDLHGPDRDLFAVACLHLAALIPLTSLIPLDPHKLDELLSAAQQWFPTASLQSVRSTMLRSAQVQRSYSAPAVDHLDSLAGGLRRRFGRVEHAGLHDGQHGVVLALGRARHRATLKVIPFREGDPDALGLFTGHAQDFLRGEVTQELREAAHRAAHQSERVDLEGGLAGLGCALIGGSDNRDHQAIDQIAVRLRALVRQADRLRQLAPGLLGGPSGIAMFLALHARVRNDDESLRVAEQALSVDLERLERTDEVGLQLRHNGRLVPFLGWGSAGVGVAALQVRNAGGTSVTTELLRGVRDAAATPFTAHAGLLTGRAGLVHFLVDLSEFERPGNERDRVSTLLDRHQEMFELHRLCTSDGDRYPGAQLDAPDDGFAHGSAGVLSALIAIRDHASGREVDRALPSFLRGGAR